MNFLRNTFCKTNLLESLRASAIWALSALTLCATSQHFPHIVSSDSFFTDLIYKWRAELRPYDSTYSDIVLVEFDDNLLSQLPYRSPIDRCVISQAINEIEQHKPKVIGVDLIIDEPTEPPKDQALLNTARLLGDRLVLASYTSAIRPDYDPAAYLRDNGIPLQQIASATLIKDHDSTVRTASDSDTGLYPSFARVLADRFQGKTLSKKYDSAPYVIDWTNHPSEGTHPIVRIPIQHFLNNFNYPDLDCPPLPFEIPPSSSLMLDHIQKLIFDKVVIIGANLYNDDRHLSPFDLSKNQRATLTGAQIHANITQQLIDGRIITQPGFFITFLYVMFAFFLCQTINRHLKNQYNRYGGVISETPHSPWTSLLDRIFGKKRSQLNVNPFPVLPGLLISCVIILVEFIGITFLAYTIPAGLMLMAVGIVFGVEFINLVRN